jgi:hypothetical protein
MVLIRNLMQIFPKALLIRDCYCNSWRLFSGSCFSGFKDWNRFHNRFWEGRGFGRVAAACIYRVLVPGGNWLSPLKNWSIKQVLAGFFEAISYLDTEGLVPRCPENAR